MNDNLDVIRINTDAWQNDLAKTTQIEQVNIEIFPLVPETHPALMKVMPYFDFKNPPVDPNKFASSLVETCKKHGALGLSANQCGYEYRVFVMGSGDNYVAFFNPLITSVFDGTEKMEEGCLSFMDLFLSIERPKNITVMYDDYTGTTKETTFTGLTARCFQHELDHMNGILYTHIAKPLALQMAMKKRTKLADTRRKLQKQLMSKVKNVSKQLAGTR
jgi:peptide deformylase